LLDGGFTLNKNIPGRYHTVGSEFLERVKPMFTSTKETMRVTDGQYYSYNGLDYVCRLKKLFQLECRLSNQFPPFNNTEQTEIYILVNQLDLDLIVPIRIVKLGGESLLNPYHLYK
jgi:hypothetical protein